MCRCGGCAGVPHEGRGGVPRAGAWLGAGHWGQHGPGRQHRDRVAKDHGQYSITVTFMLFRKAAEYYYFPSVHNTDKVMPWPMAYWPTLRIIYCALKKSSSSDFPKVSMSKLRNSTQ